MLPFLKRGYIKRVIRLNATRKGLLGGSTPWRAVWVMLTLRKGWSKVSKSSKKSVSQPSDACEPKLAREHEANRQMIRI